jgi:toxin ParE1/3/4
VRVVWLRRALGNLRSEAEFIARDNPRAARDVVGRIRIAVDYLSDHPSIGRTGRVLGTRELVVPDTHYILPYRVRANRIEILRVFHTSRRWPEDV